jgi:hypothetical protein
MKHYYEPQMDAQDEQYKREHQGIPQPPDGVTDLPIYAPAAGIVAGIAEEHTPIGKQITFLPDGVQFKVRLFHVWPREGLRVGQHLASGEQMGVIGAHQGTDIAVQIGQMPWNEEFVSYFDVMPADIFAAYQARGLASRSDVVLTKEYRDAHPLQCDGATQKDGFVYPEGYDPDADYVHLSGYVAPVRENLPGN